jgi:hypothetical protein
MACKHGQEKDHLHVHTLLFVGLARILKASLREP